MNGIANKTLSVICLSFYSQDRLRKVWDRLNEMLTKENIPFELIIIDDGSKDNTFQIARELAVRHKNIKAYQLSKNYTSHYSMFAGLSQASGACATVIPDDEQLPYQTVVKMYRLWESGEKIVIPHRLTRDDSLISNLFSKLYYKIFNFLSSVQYPQGGADSFLIDREVVDILNNHIHPIHTAAIPEILRLGFDPFFLAYDRPKGNNEKSRWNFRKKLKLASDTIFSCSSFPIKLITFSGLFFSIVAFLMIIFYAYIKLLGDKAIWGYEPKGWTSLVLFIAFFSGIILFSLGVIAEYIWRIYEEVKGRPGFIIKKGLYERGMEHDNDNG